MEIETSGAPENLLDSPNDILSANRPAVRIESFGKRLLIRVLRGFRKKILDFVRRHHAEHELEHIFHLLHDGIERKIDAFEFFVQLVPDARLNRVGIAEVPRSHTLRLPVAVETPHTLVQTHGIPRKVDMEQHVAVLLQVVAHSVFK